jgi:hypothetical protein
VNYGENTMKIFSYIVGMSLLPVFCNLQAANYCGDLTGSHGPFDYTDSANRTTVGINTSILELVERAHFTPNVEKLIKGNTGALGGDLAYTLMMFPNHHRALVSIGNLAIRDKIIKPHGMTYSIECYFNRAMRFKPDDVMVRMIYGLYLSKSGKINDAIQQLNEAVRLEPENANFNYNLGLLYAKNKDFENAKIYAKNAYRMGFPLQGLKNTLTAAGKWSD